ncbi:hypothetical protein BIV57_04830 [Mangrovactinospora gilvigrisea]|uniref:Lipid/polyisoprenoid-binding YceI-like domain-containing protein n=1 Tax=Mangrovactinospora gilvigrisea TaxID=1428644 RepID=A0A1J7BIW4_9ACTN|nr:YceI family protein [Mangrovactinospora gilvigrisea]OIV38582.1 hypothetical protein BIV57_04830 [Mangrovactinospora gilvigrisea]
MQDRSGDAPGLRARVRGNDGWAVPGAVLTVTDMTGSQAARAVAGDDGTVRTEPVSAGVYTVIVTAPGYAPAASTAIVPASGSSDLGNLTVERLGGQQLPPPGVWTIDPAHSSVAASAQHLGMSSVRGRFTRFSGRIEVGGRAEESSVSAEIDADSIDTGNGMRDKHLRSADFMDVEKNPVITYAGSRVTPLGPDRYTVHGDLTLHGVSHAVDLDLTYMGTGPDPWGGTRLALRAVTELQRSDFAMNYNQMVRAGIAAIGTTLKIELDIQAVQGDSLPQA